MESDAESPGYDEEQGDGRYDDRTSHTYHARRVPIPPSGISIEGDRVRWLVCCVHHAYPVDATQGQARVGT